MSGLCSGAAAEPANGERPAEQGAGTQPPARAARIVLRGAPPLVCVAVGLLAGDAAAGADVLAPLPLLAAGAGGAVWLVGAAADPAWRRLALAVLAAALGNVQAARVYAPHLPRDHVAAAARVPLTLEGVLLDDPDVSDTRARLLLAAERLDDGSGWRAARGRVLLGVRRLERVWHAGDRVGAHVRLRRPRNYGTPGEFDYERYLARRAIYATAFVADDGEFYRAGPPARRPWLAGWRRGVGELFRRTLSPPQAAVLGALILGTEGALPLGVRAAFSRAGVSHVLSISGLHVALVAAASAQLCRWLLTRSGWLLLTLNVPKLAVGLSVVPVLLYAGLAGGNVATTRSVIMILVFMGAVLVDRQRHTIVSLSVAAILVLLVNPGASLDISFQLSFVAVLGLVLGLARFWPWWLRWEEAHLLRLRGRWARLWRPLAVYLVVSASALAATTPLTALHFNQVSLMAPLANAVVVPLLGSAAVSLGLLAALLYPLAPAAARGCVLLAQPFLAVGLWLVETLAAWPYAAVRVVTPTVFELALLYAGLWMLVCGTRRARAWRLLLLALLGVADGAWWCADRYHRTALRVTFLSVGQGDSAVVEFPGSAVMVIDGGGSASETFDIGERVIAPFLWRRKIARVDYLVLSHGQWDHAGGLIFLAKQFAPAEFWSNGERPTGARFQGLYQALRDSHTCRLAMRRGVQRRIGAVEVTVHGPPAAADWLRENDRSLVLSLRFAGARLLFTGDIEAAGEEALLAADAPPVASTVLKVPHHGSATSSSARFLDAVAPRLAVVSTGFDNSFAFPRPNVVCRYAARRIALARTDLDGAVTVWLRAPGTLAVQRFRRSSRDRPPPACPAGVDSPAGGG